LNRHCQDPRCGTMSGIFLSLQTHRHQKRADRTSEPVDAICFCSLSAFASGLRETTGRQKYERHVTASQAVLVLGDC
jgi:hypothetical protein